MVSRDQWNTWSDGEKLDYLFRHSQSTEEVLERFGRHLQGLHERMKKLEATEKL